MRSNELTAAARVACKQALPLKMARGQHIRAW